MTGDRAKYRVKGDPTTIRKKWLVCDRYSKPNSTVYSDKRIRQDRGSVKIDYKIEATVTQVEKFSDVWLFEFELLIGGVVRPQLFNLLR